jgi:c-di-GMP phosphodiesterase
MDLTKKLHSMQLQIEKLGGGHCLLIKLINYDELCTMIGSAQGIVLELYKIVRKSCESYRNQVFSQIEYNKILVVLPLMEDQELRQLVYDIYSRGQLYVDPILPFAYINCHIASIDFPEHSKNAVEIYTLLITRIASFKKNYYYYAYNKDLHSIENIKFNNKKLNFLRRAVINKKLQFAYQPIIDRNTGETPYYECLLRFPDENNELISIGPLVTEAENKGLINIIDHIALEMAIIELQNNQDLQLSVNISNIGIVDENLLTYAHKLLDQYKVAPRLIIEVTETCINEDYEKTKFFMNSLHKYGCRFALDDFGSGFTSFKQLQNLPIDIVKIDGSYIRNIMNSTHSKYFVEALIKMSDDLKIKTVAEFVENGEIAKFLIDLKIDGMQGDYFSPASSVRK